MQSDPMPFFSWMKLGIDSNLRTKKHYPNSPKNKRHAAG
ncbi:hypothetical protein RISK_005209 [Rhodopirellula islandica]|uniref:Uncharacterized protein n=1 Tax=Rhodopirellula islandica TaxID=595434 RepID=A0A0J1B8P4_RHOIS|nr:hypothetical protein RISK_005209 [Rhodopirellula islandica]